jgi:hypothetical protein
MSCPFRKLYPREAMMQPRQNGRSGNISVPLDRDSGRDALEGRVEVRPESLHSGDDRNGNARRLRE